MVHPLQAELSSDLERVWLAALDDAGIPADQALLFTFPERHSPDRQGAVYMRRGVTTVIDGLDAALLDLLNDQASGRVGAYRVLLWTERKLEGSAALIRHELEHGRQIDCRFEVQELCDLAERVVRLDPDYGRLYQQIPAEADANAAAGAWVRSYFGSIVIDQLVLDGDRDVAALRSTEPPPSPADLPERMVDFFASIPDACLRWARHWKLSSFSRTLDTAWHGAGRKWEQMTGIPRDAPGG